VIDPELFRIVDLSLWDESLPCDSFFLYRIGRTLLGLRVEHADDPEVTIHHIFGSAKSAAEAMDLLRRAGEDKAISRAVSDLLESIGQSGS
jgi:hypothetical protein